MLYNEKKYNEQLRIFTASKLKMINEFDFEFMIYFNTRKVKHILKALIPEIKISCIT